MAQANQAGTFRRGLDVQMNHSDFTRGKFRYQYPRMQKNKQRNKTDYSGLKIATAEWRPSCSHAYMKAGTKTGTRFHMDELK